MAGDEWASITPEYLGEYDEYVTSFLESKFTQREREQLGAKVVGKFEHAVEDGLRNSYLEWMKSSLERSKLTQVEAGIRMGVRHSSVGRWLSGKSEMPTDRFRKFYLLFGGRDEGDHPAIPVGVLNLRGYRVAVGYVRELLEAAEDAGRRGASDVKLARIFKQLDSGKIYVFDPAKLLWMNYYYSTQSILNQIDMEVYQKYRKWILLKGLVEHYGLFDPGKTAWGTFEELDADLDSWGMAWLICVRLLAEANGIICPEFVSASRPVRFRRRVR